MPASSARPSLGLLLLLLLSWLSPSALAAERLAVLEVPSSEDSESVLSYLSDKLRSGALVASQAGELGLEIMTRESMAAILSDMGLDAACAEGQCEVETARNLKAAYVLSGSLTALSDQQILVLKLHAAGPGSLLATREVKGASLEALPDPAEAASYALLCQGLELDCVPWEERVDAGFVSEELNVEQRLEEQRCQEALEPLAASQRAARVERARAELLRQAREAWEILEPQTADCLALDTASREPCVEAVEAWLRTARGLRVELPAGVETAETDCGPRERAFEAQLELVQVPEQDAAEQRLAELTGESSPPLLRAEQLEHGDDGTPRDPEAATPLYRQACKRGEARACVELALKHFWGRGGQLARGAADRIVESANLPLLETQCEEGDGRSCLHLGNLHKLGLFVERDLLAAADFYQRSCELGDGTGCHSLGWMAEWGEGIPQDDARALALYQEACDLGQGLGCSQMGTLYALGRGVPKDDQQALDFFEQARSLGEAEGHTALAQRSLDGESGAPDPARAAGLFEQACALGAGDACRKLAALYAEGTGLEPDPARASALCQRACNLGDAEGCLELAWRALRGGDRPPSPALARSLFGKAAELGQPEGLFGLGEILAEGLLGPPDPVRAAQRYQQACDLGVAAGCQRLAGLYASDQGLSQDLLRAASLYQRACDLGEGSSCAYLAGQILRGEGLAEDRERAAELLERACELGVEEACP